ncbi:unnamed protein product [Caenorhabditis auriculariae]|uniref:Uncharacterized protein n=1 Tax=Caenorhabditis auriculariae TaxID=2777116 RepID=A0A8S1HRP6_9PELO|nr:unnamed protein product [Caenorhabditis auriculariae]
MPSPTRQQTPTYTDFIAFMQQMQKDQQNFQKNMVDMIRTLTSSNVSSQASSPSIDVYGLLMNEIESFNYDADGTSTFDDWLCPRMKKCRFTPPAIVRGMGQGSDDARPRHLNINLDDSPRKSHFRKPKMREHT